MAASSLSAGLALRSLLTASEGVTALTSSVFPVATDSATLPYVAYARKSLYHDPTKSGSGSERVEVDVNCYASDYAGSVELAEAVRAALEYQSTDGAPAIRSIILTNASEYWESDAFVQSLTFQLYV